MSALLSRTRAVEDLARLLPGEVADTVADEMLAEPHTAAALRVLASVRDERWRRYVYPSRIDWPDLLRWGRTRLEPGGSVLVRLEVAASLAGYSDARADLLRAARVLDPYNWAALLDALAIAREGLE